MELEFFLTEDDELIWLVKGADEDDDADDDKDDKDDKDDDADADDDSDDDDADDDKDDKSKKDDKTSRRHPRSGRPAKYTPPSQAEWARTQAALKKANDEQRTARKASLDKAKKEGQEEAATKARNDAEEEMTGKYVPGIIKAHAKSELVAAGCTNPTRLVRLLDTTGVTLDDNLEPVGLEAKIRELQDEWPEMFKKDGDDTTKDKKTPVKKAPAPKDVDAGDKDKKGTGDKKPSAAERLANALTGTKS